jgi:hypothetical protein
MFDSADNRGRDNRRGGKASFRIPNPALRIGMSALEKPAENT